MLFLAVGVGYGATRGCSKVRAWFDRPEQVEPRRLQHQKSRSDHSRGRKAPPRRGWCGFRAARSGWARPTSTRTSRTRPEHEVEVDGFWMDETEVTNAQFAEFVEATGYVTIAEQKPTLE